MMKRILLVWVCLMATATAWAQDTVYSCDFDHPGDSAGWLMAGDGQSHYWVEGQATNMTSGGLFVTYNGTDNACYFYSPRSVSYAYRRLVLPRGAYRFSYDWRCNGLRIGNEAYDFLRVMLVEGAATPVAGEVPAGMTSVPSGSLPAGCTSLDGGGPLCASAVWVRQSADCFVEDSGVYTLVFMWFSSVAQNDPPAAVDNLLVTRPRCPQPYDLRTSWLTPTSMTVHWRDMGDGNTTDWAVELCSGSQTYGGGIRQWVQDTAVSLTGLTPNRDYRVYVSAVCDSDTADPVVLQVHTPCANMTALPYSQHFEGVALGAMPMCWRVLKTDGDVKVQGGDDARWLKWDVARLGYCCVVLPGVDTGATPAGDMQLRFVVRGEPGYWRHSHEFEVGLLPNPMDVGSFVPVGRVVVSSDQWEECVVELDGYSGGNIAILDMGNELMDSYVLFDDIEIGRAVACQQVNHLTVGRVTASSAMVEWEVLRGTVHVPGGYDVWVEEADALVPTPTAPDSNCRHLYSTEPHCIVTGLQPGTTHRAWVRARCADNVGSEWCCVVFTTMHQPCMMVDTTTDDTLSIGDGVVHTTGVPVSYLFVNSLCQSIYTADELHAAGLEAGYITGIDYTFTNNPRNMLVSLYVSTTTDSLYASVDDMVGVRNSELVYGPAMYAAGNSGTVHFEFDQPFTWNGMENLVLTSFINNAAGAMQSPSFYGNSTLANGNRTVHSYLNDEPFTIANLTTGTASTSGYRPSVTFHTMECAVAGECAPPIVMVQSVGEDYAQLEWMPGMGDTAWGVWYRRVGDTLWSVADNYVDTNYYLLSPLEANADYEVSVVHHCGGDSLWGEVRFATPCASVYELPWVEDFENFVAPRHLEDPQEPCWYRGTTDLLCWINNSGDYAYSGVQSLRFSSQYWYIRQYIAMPAMGMDLSDLQVSFFAYGLDDYQLRVGVMTDPNDLASFVEVARVTNTNLNTWELKVVPLGSYEGEGRHIALVTMGRTPNRVYIDDLMVDYVETCPRPNNIAFGIVTRHTAEVQWDGGGASRYELEYGRRGFVPGTGTLLTCSADTVTLRGLDHSTRYELRVRAFCGGDTSRWSVMAPFTTACGEIESLPYTHNFEEMDGLPLPMCWVCNASTVVNYMGVGEQQEKKVLYMYDRNGGGDVAYAVLPAVDSALGNIHTLQLVVKASSDTTYTPIFSHDLIVGVCATEGDITTFMPIDTLTLTPTLEVYEVPLVAAAGLGRYVALMSVPTGLALNNRVYLDSLAIEPLPSCVRPRGLAVTALTTTTATVAWTNDAGATQWQVEYMPHGTPVGTGLRQTVGTNSLTIGGLAPATTYDFYVRSICGEGDTSEWCHTPGLIVTQQIPAMVPYSYGFDTVAEWSNWQSMSNYSAVWCRGEAVGMPAPSMYVSVDSGATCSTLLNRVINSVVYRDFDFGSGDTSYVISFDASVGGVHYGNYYYDGLAVFLVDPVVVPNMPSSYVYESPWGNINSLTLLANIQGSPNWTNYHFTIDSLRGVQRLVFYWYGQGNVAYYATPTMGMPGAVDNLSIQYVECQRPYSVRATEVTAVSARVRWHGPEDADYRVMLYDADMALIADDTVHAASNYYGLLMPGSVYRVRVGRLCEGTLGYLTPLTAFSTLACGGGAIDTIGGREEVSSSYTLPVHTCYRYSYTQQLVSASELGEAGDITSISFLYDSPLRMTGKNNCTIYLGHTTMRNFASWTDSVPRSEMQVVYIGPINCSQGWNRILLETPFAYDGVSNLVVAVDDRSGRSHNYNYRFATSATDLPMSLAFFALNAADVATNHLSRQLCRYRNVFTIEVCPPNTCPRPRLRSPRVRTNNVTLHWYNTSDRYLVGYRLANSDLWIENNVLTTDTFLTITNYYFDTDYVYHVSQYCDDGVSNWSIGSFNTADIPCLPPLGLTVTDITNRAAHFHWTPDDNNISYRLHVWNSAFDTIVTAYLASCSVDGLNAASRYYAAVEVRCEYYDEPSIWSDTISFTTPSCPDATNLVAQEVHGNSVLLDWQCDESVREWLVEWGRQGFDQGEGITVTADHHPFLLTGLTGETTYDIIVRSLCGGDYVSEGWSNRLTVTTAYSGIEETGHDARVYLYPNPTDGDVQLVLPAARGAVRVEVIDMLGRVHQTHTLPPHTVRILLPTSQLPQGVYYVRLTGSSLNVVVKLEIDN